MFTSPWERLVPQRKIYCSSSKTSSTWIVSVKWYMKCFIYWTPDLKWIVLWNKSHRKQNKNRPRRNAVKSFTLSDFSLYIDFVTHQWLGNPKRNCVCPIRYCVDSLMLWSAHLARRPLKNEKRTRKDNKCFLWQLLCICKQDQNITFPYKIATRNL